MKTKFTKKQKLIILAYIAFTKFAINPDIDRLVGDLTIIENELKKSKSNKEKNIWFRFFPGDTLATTIDNLERCFKYESQNNKEYYMEGISSAIHFLTLEMNFS